MTGLASWGASSTRSGRARQTSSLVPGWQAASHPGAMPWHAVFGNRLAATLIRWLYGISLTDLGPFRAVRSEVLRALELREMTYGWAVELMTRGAMRGYRVMEVPVSYHPRIGVSKISGTWRGSIGAAWYILTGIVKNRLGSATAPVEPGPAT